MPASSLVNDPLRSCPPSNLWNVPREAREAGGGEVVVGEEDLPHAGEVDVRLEGVGHLGEARQVDVALEARRRAVGEEADARQLDVGAVDQEVGVQIEPHRHEVADPQDASRRCGMAAIVEDLGDRQVHVRQVDAPVRPVVLEAELALGRPQVLQGRDEPPPRLGVRLGRVRGQRIGNDGDGLLTGFGGGFSIRLAHEGGKALAAVGERLGQHPPVPHVHRVGEELPVQQGRPHHRQRDLSRREEGPVTGVQPSDGQVLDAETAAKQPDADPADADLALQIGAQRPLGPGPARPGRGRSSRARRGPPRRRRRLPPRSAARNGGTTSGSTRNAAHAAGRSPPAAPVTPVRRPRGGAASRPPATPGQRSSPAAPVTPVRRPRGDAASRPPATPGQRRADRPRSAPFAVRPLPRKRAVRDPGPSSGGSTSPPAGREVGAPPRFRLVTRPPPRSG